MRTPQSVAAIAAVALVLTSCSSHVTSTPSAGSTNPPSGSASTPAETITACPAAIPAIPKTATPDTHHLAPSDPTSAVLCFYPGLNAHDRQPVGPIRVHQAVALATLLNKATPAPSGFISCPMDDASMDVVIFTQAVGGPVTVEIPRTGCRFGVSTIASGAFQLTAAGLAALDALNPSQAR